MWRTFEKRMEAFYLASGGMLVMFLGALKEIALTKRDRRRILQQMIIVGWDTVPLALLIGLFTGMTVALGVGIVVVQFGQEAFIAPVVAESMVKEMGPVFTAFIIAARVGAAMTAELGTMAVNEEVNVLRMLGIRVNRYLVMPRVVAALTMMPLLTAYSTFIGLVGGGFIAYVYFDVSPIVYQLESFRFMTVDEFWKAFVKTLVFGAIYSSVCCWFGINTTGGAKGVGKSTTAAVVVSLAGILIANYLLSAFLYA